MPPRNNGAERRSGSPRGNSVTARRQQALADHVARSFGVIAWRELRALGFGKSTISGMVDRGTLVPITHGVYAVGHRHLTREGWWSVAVRAGGDDALLSHRAGGAVRGLLRAVTTTDIIVSGAGGRGLRQIRPHRCDIDDDDRDVVHGLPTTSLARTMMDIAGREPRRLVEALEQSLILQVYDHREMEAIIKRYRGCRGVARLRAAIDVLPDDPGLFRSRAERRARDLILAAGMHAPEVNFWFVAGAGGGYELDLFWPGLWRNVEIDGPRHDLPWQQAIDRRRDSDLAARGVAVQRHRVEALHRAPDRFVASVAAFLAEAR